MYPRLALLTLCALYFFIFPRPVIAQSYINVDEVFQKINCPKLSLKDYKRAINYGNVLGFIYDNKFLEDYDGRFAKVLLKVLLDFPTIKCIRLSYDKNEISDRYINLGFYATRQLIFYKDGNKLDRVDGGPNPGSTELWIPWLKSKLKKYYGLE